MHVNGLNFIETCFIIFMKNEDFVDFCILKF